jgi:hypothetical protein
MTYCMSIPCAPLPRRVSIMVSMNHDLMIGRRYSRKSKIQHNYVVPLVSRLMFV